MDTELNLGYELAYSVAGDSYPWWRPLSGLAFGCMFGLTLFAVYLLARRRTGSFANPVRAVDSEARRRGAALVFFVPAGAGLIWAVFTVALGYPRYREAVQLEEEDRCALVEGVVEDFQPMTGFSKHERFRIRDSEFDYSDGRGQLGFSWTNNREGPIRQGQSVRICYWRLPSGDNVILRLEVQRRHP